MRTRLDLILHSAVEQRVPKGAYQRFFLERLQEFFSTKAIDLSAELGLPPGQGIFKCRPEAHAALLAHFQKETP